MEIIKKLFILFCMIVLVGNVSAADWGIDNFKKFDKNIGSKGKIEVWDSGFLFFGKDTKLNEMILEEHHYSVFTGYSKIRVETFEEGNLMEKMNIYGRDGKDAKQGLKNLEIIFKREINKSKNITDYSESCLIITETNGTRESCENLISGSHLEYYNDYEEFDYQFGQDVPIGNYTIELYGTRYNMNTGMIDWIFNTRGISTTEWATWWDTDFIYCQNISITSGFNFNNRSDIVIVSLDDPLGHIRSDGGDIRVINTTCQDGGDELKYNLIDTSAGNINFSIKVENMTGLNVNYSIYYGNSGASTTEDNTVPIILQNDSNMDAERGNETASWQWNQTATQDRGITVRDVDFGDGAYVTGSWGVGSASPDSARGTARSQPFYLGDTFTYQFKNNGVGTVTAGIDINNDGTINLFFSQTTSGTLDTSGNLSKLASVMLDDDSTGGGGWLIADTFFNKIGATKILDYPLSYSLGSEESSQGVSTLLISPIDGFNSSLSEIEFIFNSTPVQVNLTNATLSVWHSNGSLSNTDFTVLSGNATVTTTTNLTIDDGNYTWNVLTEGTSDTSGMDTNRTLEIDTTLPNINVTSPRGIIDYHVVGNNLTINWSVIDVNLDSCWFNYNSTNTSVTCGNNNYSFITTTQQNLTFFANDTFGNENSNFTSWEFLFQTYNVTFNNQTFEGVQENFTAEIILSGGNTISEAIFYYNNTNYTTSIIFSGGEYLVGSTITIPLVESTTNFSLGFYIVTGGQTYNLETFQQEVFNINMSICSPGGNLLLNMTLYEEETKTMIVGDIEFNAQAISKTSNEIIESIELSVENTSSVEICLSPLLSFTNLYLDTEIKYSSTGYEPELYHIQQADMIEYPKNLSLFDLLTNKSTKFLIKYQDDDLISVEGAIIQLQRKYISEDIFEIVEAPLTSDIGTAIVHINLNTNKYQVTVVKDGEVLDIFPNLNFNCENELAGQCTENLFGRIDSQNNVPLIQLEDFAYSISSFNNTVTTLFTIPSGTPSSVNIVLTQRDQFGNESLCNQTIISSAGSIDCTYADTIGDSFLLLEISKDGLLKANEGFRVVQDSGLDFLGNNFFLVIIMMLSVVGMAFSSPELIILNAIIVMILGGAFWLLNGVDFVMGLGSLIWLIVSAGILIYSLSKQEDR